MIPMVAMRYWRKIEHSWRDGSKSTATYGRADEHFDNRNSGVASDREEFRINHRQQISQRVTINADGLHSQSVSSDQKRNSLEISGDYELGEWTLTGGSRHIERLSSTSDDEITTAIVGVGRSFDVFGRELSINSEYEQDLQSSERNRWELNSDYQLMDKLNAYSRYEDINSLSGVSGLSSDEEVRSFIFGLETDWLPSTQSYSEYRLRGSNNARDLVSATGIRGDYEVRPGLKISPNIEHIAALDGHEQGDSTALSVGYSDSRDANSRKLGRFETRHSKQQDYYAIDLSYVARVNEDWSGIVREDLRFTESNSGQEQIEHVFTLGLARRPRRDNYQHMMFMYQWKEDSEEDGNDRSAHLLSLHQNAKFGEHWIASGRLGYKYQQYDVLSTDFSSDVILLDSRITWDINRRWDMDVIAGVLATNSFDESRFALGFGFNYLIKKNLRVGVSYKFAGFRERDLDEEEYNKKGFSIGMQYKFDESIFGWLTDE